MWDLIVEKGFEKTKMGSLCVGSGCACQIENFRYVLNSNWRCIVPQPYVTKVYTKSSEYI